MVLQLIKVSRNIFETTKYFLSSSHLRPAVAELRAAGGKGRTPEPPVDLRGSEGRRRAAAPPTARPQQLQLGGVVRHGDGPGHAHQRRHNVRPLHRVHGHLHVNQSSSILIDNHCLQNFNLIRKSDLFFSVEKILRVKNQIDRYLDISTK